MLHPVVKVSYPITKQKGITQRPEKAKFFVRITKDLHYRKVYKRPDKKPTERRIRSFHDEQNNDSNKSKKPNNPFFYFKADGQEDYYRRNKTQDFKKSCGINLAPIVRVIKNGWVDPPNHHS